MKIKTALFLGVVTLFFIQATSPEWGFFGHRKINRMAVFTLPQEMLPFYKFHIEYITQHAVDPDKRRYATKHEFTRHYIDIDHWSVYPFEDVPRQYSHAFMKYNNFFSINASDTLEFKLKQYDEISFPETAEGRTLNNVFYEHIYPNRYEDEISCECDPLREFIELPADCEKIIIEDKLAEYGSIPYFFPEHYNKLVRAFERKDGKRIIQLSAEIGHYIGDAHVPLHTTENYNGQLTNQVGIHGFWESRLPELFADDDYDFFVGKADYIKSVPKWIWDVILDSHALLDGVLMNEKELQETFPSDQQYCFEERLELTIRTQCEGYSKAYHDRLDGMVEKRMQESILGIGSIWLSAWIDAGQPDLTTLIDVEWTKADEEEEKALESSFRNEKIKGRDHGN